MEFLLRGIEAEPGTASEDAAGLFMTVLDGKVKEKGAAWTKPSNILGLTVFVSFLMTNSALLALA